MEKEEKDRDIIQPATESGNESVSTSEKSQGSRKPITIKNYWWVGVILVVIISILVFGFILLQNSKSARDKLDQELRNQEQQAQEQQSPDEQQNKDNGEVIRWPSPTAKYITAVPVDLTQISSISKYRSCAGHIRDGYDFNQVNEFDRSMKHYFYPTTTFQGTDNKIKLYAPFDGTVQAIYWEKDKVGGRPNNGNGIDLATPVDPNVVFGFGHLYFVKDFNVGDTVTAGELIGYAATRCGGQKGGCDFDLDLKGIRRIGDAPGVVGREILGSVFDHMTDTVLAEFAQYGVTPQNVIDTKEYRDAHPCNYVKPDQSSSPLGQRPGESWLVVTH